VNLDFMPILVLMEAFGTKKTAQAGTISTLSMLRPNMQTKVVRHPRSAGTKLVIT
jgi:hypothetical protein